MSTKCQKNEEKMIINAIQHHDVYDRFTMEHFPLRQNDDQNFGIINFILLFVKFLF
jgi:hypothetical protein